jgi:uncharacterized membrane protein (UPF0127 family)
MVLRNVTSNETVATRIDKADSFIKRAVGLLGRSSLPSDEGLWFDKCSAIHTLGMRMPIDVIFIDKAFNVMALHHSVGSGNWALTCRGAHGIIELSSGTLVRLDIDPGDKLELI